MVIMDNRKHELIENFTCLYVNLNEHNKYY